MTGVSARLRRATPPAVLVLGIVLVALNLRPGIAGFGPLLPQIQRELGVSAATVSLLTTIPLLCWGFLALLAPLLVRRWPPEGVILGLMALLTVGAALRAGPSLAWILVGTVLLGSGIAVVNVLLPALVREFFPGRLGLMLGVYTLTVVGGASIASALAVPLRGAFGGSWRASLGTWAVLGVLGTLAWVPVVLGRPARPARGVTPTQGLRRNPYAWPVTLFMGSQSLVFFTWLTWLAKVLQDQGWSAGYSGGVLFLGNLVQLPFALGLPILAARLRSAFPLVLLAVGCMLVGLLGLALLPAYALAWVLVLGAGSGSAFPLALHFMAQRAASPGQVASLSALAQGVGYLIAATGPFVFGVLHDLTRGWAAPFGFLLAMLVVVTVTGWQASRPPAPAPTGRAR